MLNNKKMRIVSLAVSMLCFTEKVVYPNFIDQVGVAAAVVAGFVGAAKLSEWCFSESNRQLAIRANAEYGNAIRYSDIIGLYESKLNINDPYAAYYAGAHKDIYEPILYDIVGALFYQGVSHPDYINELSALSARLRSLSDKLHTRIGEKQNAYLNNQELSEMNSMIHVVKQIDSILPHIQLFSAYLEYNKKYFIAYDYEGYIHSFYDKELSILLSGLAPSCMTHDLVQQILWRHSDCMYPLIYFTDSLYSNISKLKSYAKSVERLYPTRAGYINELLNQLEWMKKMIVTHETYSYELSKRDQARLEQMRIESQREKIRIEQARVEALKSQNRILNEANKLKRQELYGNLFDGSRIDELETVVTVNFNL